MSWFWVLSCPMIFLVSGCKQRTPTKHSACACACSCFVTDFCQDGVQLWITSPTYNLHVLSTGVGWFSPRAELTNGRAAMLGFAALLILEASAGVPFF